MEFIKRAADALTHAEERAAVHALKDEKKTEITTTTPAVAVVATPALATTSATAVSTESAEITTLQAATVDVVARAPVVEETIIQEQKEIIQPVIHREVEKTEIRHVIQPVYQEETLATQVHERTLQPEYRGEINGELNVLETLQAASAAAQPTLISTTAAAQTQTVVNEAIVHEIIKPHIIEEVQPVIHRTIHEPHIIHERKDIYEKIVEAPVEIVETRAPIYEKEVIVTDIPKTVYREAL
eukprot:Phypoly_transcript_15585.p1 GENE.Phypoly_transcript_15585~~Phypoly_transcript_15585.p1  ORF type:complete len:242 (+),score=58.97 Phypoly_transcript_15585:133-858(+)